MSTIENYNRILNEIKDICVSAGRNPGEIKVIAVSKTFPADMVQEAIDRGIGIFGENKVQEAKQKAVHLSGDFNLHLIGHLQSNKAKDAVRLFDLIHSIDKLSTAERVNEEANKINKVQKILVQVNTSAEDTKSGIQPGEAVAFCRSVTGFKNIKLNGLMTIGPLTENEDDIRKAFKILKDILNDCNKVLGININELSMGMSSDYKIAVEEGATMLRIGSAIFGQRDYSR